MKRFLLIVCLTMSLLLMDLLSSAQAADLKNGMKVFNANCSACHVGGGNVIIAHKALKKDALEKYGMYSLEAIETQVTKGKNAMPAFASRLNPTQIEDVAAYVMQQAQNGW